MFVEAIKKVSEFTRPIHTISRLYDTDSVVPGAATMFYVNELGYAITCKHVAEIIMQTELVNQKYQQFKTELAALPNKKFNQIKALEQKYWYNKDITVQIKNMFINCPSPFSGAEIHLHPNYDLALVKFSNWSELNYKDYAIFLKDDQQVQQGRYLCRLGFPFPEFTNYKYNSQLDDIEWTQDWRSMTPTFPIDGIITRHFIEDSWTIIWIEMSTPGLKWQSGGPLFDTTWKIYGMQSMTHHLHLGFDIKDKEILKDGKLAKVSNSPFLHLGDCVHMNIIKSFLREHDVKFYEE